MIILIFTSFIFPIFLYFINRWYNWSKSPIISLCYTVFCFNIISNIVTFVFQKHLLVDIKPSFFNFIWLCTLNGLIFVMINKWIRNRSKLYIPYKTVTCIIVLSTFIYLYFGWFLSSYGRMSFDQFLYNLKAPLNTETQNFYPKIISLASSAAFILLPFFILLWSDPMIIKKHPLSKLPHKFIIGIVFVLVSTWIALPVYTFHLEDAYIYFTSTYDIYADSYVPPNDVTITFPPKKRNLIIVFVESFESTFFTNEQGGIESEYLLPHMTSYMQEGQNFSQNDIFGGAISMPSTTWTIAGMTSTLGGVNYNIPADINQDEGDIAVLPGIVTLNDLLAHEGYQQSFIIGMNAGMYHLRHFYEFHGNAQVYDYGQSKRDGFIAEDYKKSWGMEDRKLYEYAQSKMEQIQSSEPFAMYISTNDLHGPDGYLDSSCSNRYSDYRDVIACSDDTLSQFLDWIKIQPFYENTSVIVLGDHLTHAEDYFKKYPSDVERSVFNLFLNSASPYTSYQSKHREFFAADFFPTILSSMGVEIEGDRLGLGTNLYSNKKTLIEQYGEKFIVQSLTPNSAYYNQNFLLLESEQ